MARRAQVTVEIAVLLTCHNRKALTLRCLRTLAEQAYFREENVFLVDDGSTDGTGEAVKALMPGANVVQGSGSLFWNGGMRLAWESAKSAGRPFDFYLWLNDDVELAPDAIAQLVADADATMPRGGAVIVAGPTHEPGSEVLTYGGHRCPLPDRPLRMQQVEPAGHPEALDSFSGNIVLVSRAAEEQLGNIIPDFEHIYGDLDYGFRARKAGVPMYLASRVLGACGANSVAGTSLDRSLSRWQRLQALRRESRKVHHRDWRRFVQMHDGRAWRQLAHYVSPYLRIIADRPNRNSEAIIGKTEQ
jgi:GT2 family glycosyltransferase